MHRCWLGPRGADIGLLGTGVGTQSWGCETLRDTGVGPHRQLIGTDEGPTVDVMGPSEK